MSVTRLEVLVEEPSSEAAVRILASRWAGSLSVSVHRFQGKTDLLKKLPDRLRAYREFLPATARILVLVDRDDDDCAELKHPTRSTSPSFRAFLKVFEELAAG